jgi:hypothetical protein
MGVGRFLYWEPLYVPIDDWGGGRCKRSALFAFYRAMREAAGVGGETSQGWRCLNPSLLAWLSGICQVQNRAVFVSHSWAKRKSRVAPAFLAVCG